MKDRRDGSCARLLDSKSSGQLKIAIIIFMVSVLITSTVGLLYLKQYFTFQKDFLQNTAIRTITVDSEYSDDQLNDLRVGDIKKLKDALADKFPNIETSVIPVYYCAGVTIGGKAVNIFGIDGSNSYLAGLSQMSDDTAYFINSRSGKITLEISVTHKTDSGYESDKMKTLILNSENGVSKRSPVFSDRSGHFTPASGENETVFVNMSIFMKIVSYLTDADQVEMSQSFDTGLVGLSGIYVYVKDLNSVADVLDGLTELGYGTYAPIDAFENFGETVSVFFKVFLISSVVLMIMTTVNVLLSFKAFYRVQQKDFGVLYYIGFDKKRINSMYMANLAKRFIMIGLITVLYSGILGMVLFAFAHLNYLAVFILSLIAFLILIFAIVSISIIGHYTKQNFFTLIRKSKEFE